MTTSEFFIQYGAGTAGPFLTVKVEAKIDMLPWQDRGLSYTRTGYGKKIPTQYKVKFGGRWRRVYCCIFSNTGTLYITSKGTDLIVTQY